MSYSSNLTTPVSGVLSASPILIGNNLKGSAQGVSPVYSATQGSVASQGMTTQTPTTGFSYTVAASIETVVLNPAGTLSTGTLVMPAAPINGQIVRVMSTQTVTALTVNANSSQSIVGAPTTITSSTPFKMIYILSLTTWFPFN